MTGERPTRRRIEQRVADLESGTTDAVIRVLRRDGGQLYRYPDGEPVDREAVPDAGVTIIVPEAAEAY